MLTLKPETLAIKPRKTYQLSQGYPHARLVQTMPWLEISGSAKTETNALSADAWQEWECLADFGLSRYVVRNTSQPKWGVISRDYLYSLAFSFEAKPTGTPDATTDAHFEIIGDNLWWLPDSENDYPPLIGTTFSLSGYDLSANTSADIYRTGDEVFVSDIGSYTLPCPNIDDFTHEPVDRRTTQQFDSGRTRRNTKAAGALHNLSCSFNMDIADASAWLSYYLRALPDYIEADWLDSYFGGAKRLYLAADPWELSASGSQFTLKINGVVVDG
jgi:hypothetical protein